MQNGGLKCNIKMFTRGGGAKWPNNNKKIIFTILPPLSIRLKGVNMVVFPGEYTWN